MYDYNSRQVLSFNLDTTKGYLILFILWPFLALITAIANYSKKESRKVVYIFLIYYGLNYVIAGDGADSFRYAMNLKQNALLPFSDFFKIVGGFYSNTSVDIIEPLISFIISRFTNNYHFLFSAYAALFGFFYLKSINLLHDRYLKNTGINSLILLLFFASLIPITAINGFRMYTAAWVFFFGSYHVILNRDYRYLLLAISASFVHFSYILASIVLLVYYFAGNRNLIYIPITITSFFVPQLISPLIERFSMRLSGMLAARYNSYSNEHFLLVREEEIAQTAWFMQLYYDLVFYYLIFGIIMIQLLYRDSMKQKIEKNLFSFILLFLSFVNFGQLIPTLGGRFQQIFYLFATLYLFLFYLKRPGRKISLYILAGIIPMLLYFAVVFRQGSVSINAFLFAPGLGLGLLFPGVSIADILFN